MIVDMNSLAVGGPHEGGTVILHANPTIVYTADVGYCGKSMINSCQDATITVSVDPSEITVFFAMAAFPADSRPQLVEVLLGIDYNSDRFVLTSTGHCADREFNTDDWPLPGSGTVVGWMSAQSSILLELRWFAGYSDQFTTFKLGPHPTQGGHFIADGPTSPIDDIADYGMLGFGESGYLPCPDGPIPVEERSWGGLKTQFR